MIVSVHQPQFLPWLGYFEKIYRSDCFVILDTVQFKKNEFQNRNKIRTPDGWQWLTVPVGYKFPMRIDEVPINNQSNWRRKHLQSLLANYKKAPFFDFAMPLAEQMYDQEWNRLADLNTWCVEASCKALEIDTPIRYAADFDLPDDPTGRLVELCRNLEATTYLSGSGGKGYLDTQQFESAGIDVSFQEYHHPTYPQRDDNFEPYMCILDLMMNCGPDSLSIMSASH
jgi:hypothetical protein